MAGGSTDLFVPEVVERFLDAHGIGEGPVSYRPLGDGHSNLTYLVERGGTRVVLRRPPRPPLPPSAHDMLRESAIVSRLHAAGARVPEVLAVCDDESLLGVPFYVMELSPGVPIDTALPPAIDTPSGRARLGEGVRRRAGRDSHAIDPEAAGLATFGRPDGYLERRIRPLPEDLAAQRHARPARGRGAWRVAARASAAAGAGDRRPRRLPGGQPARRRGPPARISAVLDWELSTIGDPLADLGYLLSMYTDDSEPAPGIRRSLRSRPSSGSSRAELARLYAARTGRDTSRIAVVRVPRALEGRRVPREHVEALPGGRPDDAFARAMEQGVPAKLAAAEAAAARDAHPV